MPSYSGKYQYLDEKGGALGQGPCQLAFDQETCTVTPASGTPLAFDLGDVDRAAPGEWELSVSLFTGRTVLLRQFGPVFGRMSQELLAAWRDRTVKCLLLEDLQENARYAGAAALGAAPAARSEIRIYKSNLAVLPEAGVPVQWRLADVDSLDFDDKTYSVTLTAGSERLVFSKLAKKTDEFVAALSATLGNLRAQSAGALHGVFPFLDPAHLQKLVALMPEGRGVAMPALAAIHPKLCSALVERAGDARLRPYFEALRASAVTDSLIAGFKFIRPDEEEPAAPESADQTASDQAPAVEAEPAEEAGEQEDEQPLFFWFFFPLAAGPGRYANVAAWEASIGSGRATYFFRLVPPEQAASLTALTTAAAIAHLTRGLALVNFRREPVYLSDDALERQPKFHRYAIGARKLPDLRRLRASMLGRALHTSFDAWSAQARTLSGK